MQLDVPLEAGLGRERLGIECPDRRELGPGLADLLLDRLAGPVRQAVVLGVDPDERGRIRMGDDRLAEVRLDQVVERLIEGTRVGRRCRPAERELFEVQFRAPTGVADRPAISSRTSRVAWTIVGMSAALTS